MRKVKKRKMFPSIEPNKNNTNMPKFKKREMYCLINPDETELTMDEIFALTNLAYFTLAKKQQSVFSKKGFVDKFNIGDGDINSFFQVLRIVKMEVGY